MHQELEPVGCVGDGRGWVSEWVWQVTGVRQLLDAVMCCAVLCQLLSYAIDLAVMPPAAAAASCGLLQALSVPCVDCVRNPPLLLQLQDVHLLVVPAAQHQGAQPEGRHKQLH